MAIPPNKNKLARAIVGISAALAWFRSDPSFVHTTSGNVDTVTDCISTKTITDGGSSALRPPYNSTDPRRPFFDFSSGTKWLGGATNLITGRGDATIMLNGKMGNSVGGVGTVVCFDPNPNASGARSFFYQASTGTTVTDNYLEGNAGVTNVWRTTSGIDSTAWHFWAVRQRYSDGVTASKPIRQDGSDLPGSTTVGGNVAGATYGTGMLVQVGSLAGTFGANVLVSDVLFAPFLTDTNADLVQKCIAALRG